ncbi:hypothetical protein LVJ83_04130 [Uruburuella testudinis]|uniref:Lipoprotein n=1 Tax=Uruburuella testudinis TaxID=1282863 RepID=A0ABY4DVL0_9NEIS|nr:hypothetical protein [Uruburuella testudinis]UOO82657.1 hypothetical protein LVJ83_04130 [Uruburuella testudinis]
MRLTLWPVCLLLAACGNDIGPDRQAAAEEAVRLFFATCVASGKSETDVAAPAGQQGFVPMDAAAVKKLPPGMMELDMQQAWQLERNGALFYLSRSPQACSIKTPLADEAALRRQFATLAEQGSAGMVVRLRADHHTASPFPYSQLVYAWQPDNEPQELLLGANTSPSKHVPVQAALNFSRRALSARPALSAE